MFEEVVRKIKESPENRIVETIYKELNSYYRTAFSLMLGPTSLFIALLSILIRGSITPLTMAIIAVISTVTIWASIALYRETKRAKDLIEELHCTFLSMKVKSCSSVDLLALVYIGATIILTIIALIKLLF